MTLELVNVMKIGSQSQTLVSLTSLLDASRQQQVQREEQQEKKLQETRDSRLTARKGEREELIRKNRDALRKIQDDIRLKNLTRLKENDDIDDEKSRDVNLNLRESFIPKAVENSQPAFKKLGQVVDIKI